MYYLPDGRWAHLPEAPQVSRRVSDHHGFTRLAIVPPESVCDLEAFELERRLQVFQASKDKV